jgi:hypothetical protein
MAGLRGLEDPNVSLGDDVERASWVWDLEQIGAPTERAHAHRLRAVCQLGIVERPKEWNLGEEVGL